MRRLGSRINNEAWTLALRQVANALPVADVTLEVPIPAKRPYPMHQQDAGVYDTFI